MTWRSRSRYHKGGWQPWVPGDRSVLHNQGRVERSSMCVDSVAGSTLAAQARPEPVPVLRHGQRCSPAFQDQADSSGWSLGICIRNKCLGQPPILGRAHPEPRNALQSETFRVPPCPHHVPQVKLSHHEICFKHKIVKSTV